jgi:arsenate reductase
MHFHPTTPEGRDLVTPKTTNHPEGHGFSRAARSQKHSGALASEVTYCKERRRMKPAISLVLLLAVALQGVAGAQGAKPGKQSKPHQVVFVCEHGAALSVVSAAYFNKLAKEQHLHVRAIARGVTPQENISAQATAGLTQDGLAPEIRKPLALSQADLDHAAQVVTFLPLPQKYSTRSNIESWSDVTWSPGSYEKSRDGILKHMQELLDRLKAETKPH